MKTIQHNGLTYYQIAGASAYFISEDGQVFTTFKQRNLTPARTKTPTGQPGYFQVWLRYDDGSQRWEKIHRLVAFTFIPNPDAKREVNHIDGDKANNAVGNLEWMTHRENIQHGRNAGLITSQRGSGHHNFGKPMSDEMKAKLSAAKQGEKHPKFTGWFTTPKGRFASANEAGTANGISGKTVKRHCLHTAPGWGFIPKPTP